MKTYTAPNAGTRYRTIVCGICGAAGGWDAMKDDVYTFVRCPVCGVTYQNPQPTPGSLRERYGEDYYRYEMENERGYLRLMLLGLEDVGFHRLDGLEERGAFLDIGCATGMLLEHMRGLGWDARGVELCEPSARHARDARGLDVRTGTLEDAGFEDGVFRVVHLSHLIEHVPDPRAFLAEVHRVLDPRGYAVIVTPNIRGFQARLFGARWRSVIADHLYLFSPRTLGRLLADTGFRVERVVTWGGIAQGMAPTFIKAPVDRLAKRLGFGDVMLVLARPLAVGGP